MTRQMKIGKRVISDKHPPLIIAEVGINHAGSFKNAIKMVDAVKNAGGECVKFQYHIPEQEMIYNNTIPGNAKESIWNIIKKNHLTEVEEKKLFKYVKKKKLIYLATPFSREAAIKLYALGVDAFKIGSGECNNYPLVDFISSFKKPIILSTGMNNLKMIKKAVKIIIKNNCKVSLLHCISSYPTEYKNLFLKNITLLKKNFKNLPIGLSDHSLGIHTSLASVALGSSIIEKHFTFSDKIKGPDIPISILPNQLRDLCVQSRDIFFANKENNISILKEEEKTIKFAYSSVVTIQDIKKNQKISLKNTWVKRPGTGDFLAKDLKKLIGKKVKKFIPKNKQIKFSDIL
jgi:sialic acid synthase SpsE